MKPFILTLCAALLPGTATAAEAARQTYTPTGGGSLLQVTFSLLLVLIVIMTVAWLIKRMNILQQGTGNLLKVIGSVSIGQRERAVLIEVNNTWLLVGVGPGQLRTLHTLDKPDDWQPDLPPESAHDNKFANVLANLIKPRTQKNVAP